jgi:ferritin-like metal-binding protein YciE
MMGKTNGQAEKNQRTIADYVGDMLALESHIEEALDRQRAEVEDSPTASAAVQRFHDMVKANRDALKAHQERVGSTGGNPIKEAGSAVLGKAAGVIDRMRTEGVSKALRDDYTAFNLAAIGYTMLNTTALALGDRATADLAERGLRGHAAAVQEINHLIADVVIWELEKDGHQLSDRQAAGKNRTMVDRIWKETAKAGGPPTATRSEAAAATGL